MITMTAQVLTSRIASGRTALTIAAPLLANAPTRALTLVNLPPAVAAKTQSLPCRRYVSTALHGVLRLPRDPNPSKGLL
jgi:hypothetical protein